MENSHVVPYWVFDGALERKRNFPHSDSYRIPVKSGDEICLTYSPTYSLSSPPVLPFTPQLFLIIHNIPRDFLRKNSSRNVTSGFREARVAGIFCFNSEGDSSSLSLSLSPTNLTTSIFLFNSAFHHTYYIFA